MESARQRQPRRFREEDGVASRPPPPRRPVGVVAPRLAALVAALLLALSACSRVYVDAPSSRAPASERQALSVVYLIGDFGKPARPFRDLAESLKTDASGLAGTPLRTAPMILELGDNLYEQGLPHDLSSTGAQAEVDKLRAIAAALAEVRHDGAQVRIAVIPGNHDYNGDALVSQDNLGDISRWYFLDELSLAGADAWTPVPGDPAGFADAAELFAHLDGDPEALATFMAPVRVPYTDRELYVVAIDSELVLDLYAGGLEELAAAYWQDLDRLLDAAPEGSWRIIAAHHPPVTYGKHGVPSLGNWVFGQGYPQFPYAWQKVLAGALPLGVVLGIVVHPLAAVLAAVPPVSTAVVSGRKQDVGSAPYDRYAAALLDRASRHDVDVIFAGHDHNTQIIELDELDEFSSDTLMVITGAGSKVDPVRRGPGTVAYLSDYSWVRLTQYGGALSFEIVDRKGSSRYRYDLSR